MRKIQIIVIFMLVSLLGCQPKVKYEKVTEGVNITLPDGALSIYPVADNAVRVKFFEGEEEPVTEFVITSEYKVPEFDVSGYGKHIRVSLKNMYVDVNRKTGNLTYFENTGKVILREKAGSRVLKPDSVMGEPCYFVEQSFESPADEAIFGLGQFQDGNYNL
nr:DUF4968 domain-containing protein [Prolixibacteraceae bacterium]